MIVVALKIIRNLLRDFDFRQGSAAGEVQRAEFAVPCDMRKLYVALAGLNH